MDPEGQRGSASASAVMASRLSKRAKLHEEHCNIEKQIYDTETSYLQDPSQCSNVLKGFEGFLSSSKITALGQGSSSLKIGSSHCLQLPHQQLKSKQLDEKMEDQTLVRDGLTVGVFMGMGRKPKKGRGGSRDSKRFRYSGEDFDYDDDPDVTL